MLCAYKQAIRTSSICMLHHPFLFTLYITSTAERNPIWNGALLNVRFTFGTLPCFCRKFHWTFNRASACLKVIMCCEVHRGFNGNHWKNMETMGAYWALLSLPYCTWNKEENIKTGITHSVHTFSDLFLHVLITTQSKKRKTTKNRTKKRERNWQNSAGIRSRVPQHSRCAP